MPQLNHPYPQPRSRSLNKAGVLLLLSGLLALLAEATVMAALMLMAGICALGSIIGWLIMKGHWLFTRLVPGHR
jgi:hypothetical protein